MSLDPESNTALILTSLILPGHFIFFLTIFFVDQMDGKNGQEKLALSISLVLFYLFFASLQVIWNIKKNIILHFIFHFNTQKGADSTNSMLFFGALNVEIKK